MDSVVYSLNYNIAELRYSLNRKEFTVHVSTDGETFDAVVSFEFVKELLDDENGFYAMQQILDHMIKLRITRDIEGKCVIQVCKRRRKLIQWKFQEEFQTLFRRVPEYIDCPNSDFDCSNWVDIERQGDRKLASIGASSKVIRFFVWN
ncbi:hypothetical protein GCK72_018384 [Caenorhabditis remanei]|uniref:Uncharacterized protein n=1 Tax=Caenorhabditis remanei TaxID=31234 RepID=A0A6A5G9W0_CAERE|nr:hypothetical protein GCK72_018384 [Caenorhabditis remanei]KAF1751830.1 hypothetical protein GCK72_018384 [Caenorhabditis remanei]